MPPRFSLVLPTYNSQRDHLDAQLASISSQDFASWECVVVDDGSTAPGLHEHLSGWSARDARINLRFRERNGGICAATNDALDVATGEYVIFCDHDDLFSVGALAVIDRSLRDRPDTDIAYTDEEMVDRHGGWVAEYRKPEFSPRRLLGHNYFNHLVVVRRAFLGADRLRREFEPAQDYDLVLRLTERTSAVLHIPEVLYSWRAAPGSVALRIDEKAGVAEAVTACVRDALARRRIDATVITESSVSCRLDARVDALSTAHLHLTGQRPEEVDQWASTVSADVLLFSLPEVTGDAWPHAVCVELALDGVGVAAPRIDSADGLLWSGGQVHAPRVHSPMRGMEATAPGPWGAHLVSREVSSVVPVAFGVRRKVFHAVGGLGARASLHEALVDLCGRARTRGWSTVCTPSASAVLPAGVAPREPTIVGRRDDYSPFGAVELPAARPTSASAPPDSPYGHAAAAVSRPGVELLTTDVFDTLVHRSVAEPHHLFVVLAQRLRRRGLLPPGVSDEVFRRGRVLAEERCRADRYRRDGTREVSIETIWDAMPSAWRAADHDDWAAYLAEELATEIDDLRVHPGAIEVLWTAADLGVRIVAVSDTYLSVPQLRYLLVGAGVPVDLMEMIVTSSTWQLSKWDGLLETIVKQLGVDASAVVHMGDHPLADVEVAERAGVTPVDLGAPAHLRRWARPRVDVSRVEGGDGRCLSTARDVLLSSQFAADPGYQFGAAVIGPVMAGFAEWVAARTEALGAPAVHCLLREGRIIADLVATVRPEGPEPVLVHASRWGILRAAVIDGSVDELVNALARRGPLTPRLVSDAFGCDERLVAAVINGEADRWTAIRLISEHDELRELIVERSAQLRRPVVAYLERRLRLAEGPVVLCDIGWGGTIQEGISAILRAGGHDHDVVGLYLMLTPPGDDRVSSGMKLCGYLPTVGADASIAASAAVVARNPEIMEQINTPEEGTLLGFDDAGTPMCAEVLRHSDSLKRAQRGVADFAHAFAALAAGERAVLQRESTRVALLHSVAAAIQFPGPQLAETVGSWHHDDVMGDDPEALMSAELRRIIPFMSAPEAFGIPMNEAFWVQGAAAMERSALLAPLEALQRGTPESEVAVRSALGLARIAAFAIGRHDAGVLTEWVPFVSPEGWVLLRVAGTLDSLRSIRIDFGDVPCLVQLGGWSIRATADTGEEVELAPAGLSDGSITWVQGRPLGICQAIVDAGGHLLVDVPEQHGARARHVDVFVGFRGWQLDDADRSLVGPTTLQRIERTAHRALRAGRRALRR
jgi:FMN phosphatase YigB (HAD superfamily)